MVRHFCFDYKIKRQVDYTGRLSLKKLEELIEPLVKRMDGPVLKALKEAGVTKEQLGSIEIVGGATRRVCPFPSPPPKKK